MPFDRLSDLPDWDALLVHPHRVTRDVDADPSGHGVAVPGHASPLVPRGDEAVVVGPMALPFAAAEARDVTEHFGVPGGELVGGPDHPGRPGLARRQRKRGQGRRRARSRWRLGDWRSRTSPGGVVPARRLAARLAVPPRRAEDEQACENEHERPAAEDDSGCGPPAQSAPGRCPPTRLIRCLLATRHGPRPFVSELLAYGSPPSTAIRTRRARGRSRPGRYSTATSLPMRRSEASARVLCATAFG